MIMNYGREGNRISKFVVPICSTYGILTYIYHPFKPNVGEYSIHGAFGMAESASLLPVTNSIPTDFYHWMCLR